LLSPLPSIRTFPPASEDGKAVVVVTLMDFTISVTCLFRYLEILIERGMIDAMSTDDTSMPSDLLEQKFVDSTARNRGDTDINRSEAIATAADLHNYEDSYGDGGFAAVNGGLNDLLAFELDNATVAAGVDTGRTCCSATITNRLSQPTAESKEYMALRLTREERDAEIHIAGPFHWEYSKVRFLMELSIVPLTVVV
jgi:hypothetical protein